MNQGTVGYALGLGRLDSAHTPPSPASLDWTWPCRAEGVGGTLSVWLDHAQRLVKGTVARGCISTFSPFRLMYECAAEVPV
jgi:hypothetical protein